MAIITLDSGLEIVDTTEEREAALTKLGEDAPRKALYL